MISAYLGSLSRRERMLIALGAVVVVVSVLYLMVLEPRYQKLQMLRSQIPAQHADIAWMRSQIEHHRALLSARETAGNSERLPVLSIVEQTATDAGLRGSISRMQPAENGQVRIWFDDVPFAAWLRWVDSLGSQRISIVAVNIDRAAEGRVNIRLTIRS